MSTDHTVFGVTFRYHPSVGLWKSEDHHIAVKCDREIFHAMIDGELLPLGFADLEIAMAYGVARFLTGPNEIVRRTFASLRARRALDHDGKPPSVH